MALIAQFAEQILNLFQRKRGRPCSPMFPSTDCRKRYAEFGREFLLSKPGTLPDLPDQSGYVTVSIQLFSPLRLGKTLIISRCRHATYQVTYSIIVKRRGVLEDFRSRHKNIPVNSAPPD